MCDLMNYGAHIALLPYPIRHWASKFLHFFDLQLQATSVFLSDKSCKFL